MPLSDVIYSRQSRRERDTGNGGWDGRMKRKNEGKGVGKGANGGRKEWTVDPGRRDQRKKEKY